MFDETTDISHVSQMSLVLRYVHQSAVREDFIKFIDIHNKICSIDDNDKEDDSLEIRSTGSNLGLVVLNTLKELNLDPKYCVGITTDGCSVMTSETRGAVVTVKTKAINAVYSPCSNHILNLSISKSSSVQSVRNSIGIMKETIAFFNASAKRSDILKKVMGHQLSGLCETRWIERHDGVLQFRVSLPKIIESLDYISSWKDIQTAAKARTLKISLCDSEFLITITCLSDLLSCTLPLSRFFQKTQIDLKSAQDMLKDTLENLQQKREMCVEKFASIYEESYGVAEELGVKIKIPRISSRQTHRQNYLTKDVVEYYRQAIYIPIIEHVTEDLKVRFPEETVDLYSFSVLFPNSVNLKDERLLKETALKLAEKYAVFFNKSIDMLHKLIIAELEL